MGQWRSNLEAAGIANLRIHDLRRSLGNCQSKTGANTAIVGKTLGHTQAQTTAVYERLGTDTVRDSLIATATEIMAATKPPKTRRKQGKRK